MEFFRKLERKYGRYAIHNLMYYIIILYGIGMMIQRASGYYQMDVVLMGIILLGIIGIIFEKIVKFLERRFTGWQETIQQ